MRRIIASIVVGMAALALAGCSSTDAAKGGAASNDGEYKVAIAQYASFPPLDEAVAGFKAALSEAGLDVTYDASNAQGDQTNVNSIASKYAAGDYDLVFAIATPMAQSIAQNVVDTPVLFTAVTDPVAAELVESNEAPGYNVTGTTDMNPVAKQIDLVKQVISDAHKVGIIYSSGEVNSQVQVKLAKAEAKKQGLEVVEKTITNTAEVQQAAQTLTGVDAIFIPTDNTVVAALDSVLQVAEEKGILTVAGESSSVNDGAALTLGLDYKTLGHQTGEMAVKILKGEAKPEAMPVEAQKTPLLVINPEAAKKQGHPIPAELMDKADKVVYQ